MSIVTINVSTTNPPTPNQLQRTGAFISQGGTSLSAGTLSLLTNISSLASILSGAKSLASLTWSGSVVTGTTSAPHGLPSGQNITLIVSGVTPAAYNGVFTCAITGASTFTYALVSNPGAATVTNATVTDEDVSELNAMNTTYWANGSSNAVYVLELGAGDAAHGVTALTSFINANQNTIYSFLVPRYWDTEATFKTMVSNYTSLSSMVDFFVTTTTSTYAAWQALAYNCIYAYVEAPAVVALAAAGTSTEFSLAADFYNTLANNPNSATPVGPQSFRFLFGVTPYPLAGNSTILASLKAANINYAITGAEGGISNVMTVYGHMLDGNPFNYWYTTDWAQINLDLNIANEVINGSNNVINPLYYSQNGIDRLQNRAASTLRSGAAAGLILGQILTVKLDALTFAANVSNGVYAGNAVVNAVPFTNYNTLNPNDYAIGKYAGLQAAITPARGFESIIFNLNITNFVA